MSTAVTTRVGLIGAGTMGNGIAQVCALAGLPVRMVDIAEAAVQRGVAPYEDIKERIEQLFVTLA